MPPRFETIVIGLGAMGSAATYQLAKAGRNVLGIDQFTPPHRFGSSHGETRITRVACGEGPEYTQFARRSHEIWKELEGDTGLQLLVQNGLLVISGAGERSAGHENPAFLATTIAAAEDGHISHEVLKATTIRERHPAFKVLDDDYAYYEPKAGFVFPEACITAQHKRAVELGARIHTGETIARFATIDGGVEVVTNRTTYAADNIIVTAGSWLPNMVSRDRAQLFTVRRQVLYWFRLKPEASVEDHKPERFPVYIWQTPSRQAIYGFPWTGDGAPTIKIATEQYDTSTTPETVDRSVTAAETTAMYEEYVAPYFPGASRECDRSAVCMYTCVDKARFIIDELPGQSRIIVASPCSGHGFKHSAAIGEALADLAMNGKAAAKKFDLSKFGMPT